MPDTRTHASLYSKTLTPVPPRLALSVSLTSLPVFVIIAAFTVLNGDSLVFVGLAAVLLFVPPLLLTRLRFDVELTDAALRYRLRPWHRTARRIPRSDITAVRVRGPEPTSVGGRRLPLGRGWVAWTADEVQYVFGGDQGVRVESSDGAVELWFEGVDEFARELTPAGREVD